MHIEVVETCPVGQILCKIQRPLFDSEGQYGKLYIYDEDRMIEAEVRMEQEVLHDLFPDGGHKGFAACVLVDDPDVPGACKVSIEALIEPIYWPEW